MTERFSNFATTTLNGGIDNAVTSIVVTSATPFPSSSQYRITIDTEIMIVTGGAGTTTWTVTRGAESTTAASHSNGAAVSHTLTAGGVGTFASLDSPTFTGVPAGPTASADTNTTQFATTANVVATAAQKTTLTTKGDVYAATAASTPARFGVGTHLTQRVVADTAASTGLKWIPHVIGLISDATGITSGNTGSTLTDTTLTMAIAASEVWVYQIMLFYTAANVTMDVKATVTAPSGATGAWGTVGVNTFNGFAPIGTGSTQLQLKALGTSDAWGSPNNGESGIYIGARVVCGATPGNVTLQLAQNTPDAGALTPKAGSSMIGWRVA